MESIPLIVASILSKKLAEGIDGLVLDVKAGRGAFMKDQAAAHALAKALVSVGRRAGKRVAALVSDMSSPIGLSIGNALETREAIEVLHDQGPPDTRELTLELGAEMLRTAGVEASRGAARKQLSRALSDGSAFECFCRMVRAQGGDVRAVEDPRKLPRARTRLPILAKTSGVVARIDALTLGVVSVALGAGRARAEDAVDAAAGIELTVRVGTRVARGEPLGFLHASSRVRAESVQRRAQAAFELGQRAAPDRTRILARLAHGSA
ncbi:MAG: thymidine phosphorylase [Polyangiaceae bacterium]